MKIRKGKLMKRKLLSLILALVMVASMLSLSLVAEAAATDVLGDANCDGKVTSDDALIVLRIAAGIEDDLSPEIKALCDTNNDGALTLYDARQILRASASLISLEKTGLFKGFSSDYSGITNQQEALEYFNTNINKIKSQKYGFTISKDVEMKTFDFEKASMFGIATDNTDDLVQRIFSTVGSDPEEDEYVVYGTSSTNKVSVEGKTYVSTLALSDVYGTRVEYDSSRDIVKITIAIPDVEKQNVFDSSYAKVFNTENLLGATENVLNKILTGIADGTEIVHYKNATLVAEFDARTGNVESYETTFDTHVYVDKAQNSVITLEGVNYSTTNTTTYIDFVHE